MQKATHIFSAKILVYMPHLIHSFNGTLTNDIVTFEQLGPDKNMSEDTQYMPQSHYTSLPRFLKMERLGNSKDTKNATYETTDVKTKNCNRRTAFE